MKQIKFLLLSVMYVFLISCGGQSIDDNDDEEEDFSLSDAHRALQLGKINHALKLYNKEIKQTPKNLRNPIYIQISSGLYDNKKYNLAKTYFDKINPKKIKKINTIDYKILQALVLFHHKNNPESAYQKCPNASIDYHYYTKRRIYLLKIATALELQKEKAFLYYSIKLDELLKKGKRKKKNIDSLWSALLNTDLDVISRLELSKNKVVKKWMELTLVIRSDNNSEQTMTDVNQWIDDNKNHPASNNISVNIINNFLSTTKSIKKIAIFLPLDDKYKNISASIIEAFQYSMQQNNPNNIKLVVYDSNNFSAYISDFFSVIKNDKIDFVVGPLQKQNVAKLALHNKLPVPFLSLNYNQNNSGNNLTTNLYQFGLLPEDEIKTIIKKTSSSGLNGAVALLPNNDIGRRISNYLRNTMSKNNGSLLSVDFYNQSTHDFGDKIKRLFMVARSQNRLNTLNNATDLNLKSSPGQIRGVDFIYTFTNHQKAREIIPQFRFYHKRQLPIFSSSTIYNNITNDMVDADVRNVMFAEMPWNIGATYDSAKMSLGGSSDGLGRYSNFYALGFDAFNLIRNINLLKSDTSAYYSGATGIITMDNKNKLHRELIMVRMLNGKPIPTR